MSDIMIDIGGERFEAKLRGELAPRTCAAFEALLPWRQQIIHARWSGEACWIPLGSLELDVGAENATTRPMAGELLLYAGGISETEILLPYGPTSFASKAGPLVGNSFLRITSDLDRLAQVGRDILWTGAKPIKFTVA